MRLLSRAGLYVQTILPLAQATERVILSGILSAVTALGLGAAWDAHWHVSIGRDSLWIPPHLLIIGGTALAGVLAATGGLRHALQARVQPPAMALSSPAVRVYGIVVAGAGLLGAAIGIDELWHRAIGDLTIWSPPHVLAVVAGIVIGAGAAAAFINAARRHVLSVALYRSLAAFFLAAIALAAYFGLLPAATMGLHPRARDLSFFSVTTPYFLAMLSALTFPALAAGSEALLGRGGFRVVAAATAVFWAIQQAFHLILTPVIAEAYGYAVRAAPAANFGFEALVLGFALLPAILGAALAAARPHLGGAAMGLAYVAGLAVWLALLERTRSPMPAELAGVVALAAAGAAAGARVGRWLRRTAEPSPSEGPPADLLESSQGR
ncbi:MAG TPA: hypothetical protein VNN19_02270 [bacterium]|nr:hypothetical protein [bacterium]